jgi:hypothetical protein
VLGSKPGIKTPRGSCGDGSAGCPRTEFESVRPIRKKNRKEGRKKGRKKEKESCRDGSVGRALAALVEDWVRFPATTWCGSQLSVTLLLGEFNALFWSSQLWHTHKII